MKSNHLTRRQLFARAQGAALACSAGATSAAGCSRRSARRASRLPSAHFHDGTAAAGLDFVQWDGGCGLQYFVEQIAAGAALLDANGDGFLDIYFPQPTPLGVCRSRYKAPLQHRLYLNDGHGRFRLAPDAFGGAVTDYGIAAAVGDYNNDGHPDIYVACCGRDTLFRNRGDGTFEDVTRQSGLGLGGMSSGAVWFDYNNDGLLDLYVVRYVEWSVTADVACLAVNGQRDACHPTTYPAATNVLYRNNGDGTFTDVTSEAGLAGDPRRSLAVAAADLHGQGRLDLFVANDQQANCLYRNLGGKFREVAMEENVAYGQGGRAQANMGIAVGDYNDDGRLDVAVTTFAREPRTLYRNDGGYFTDVSSESGVGPPTSRYLAFGTGFLDTRNSGDLDLFFADGHISPWVSLKDSELSFAEPNQLLLFQGHGRFTEAAGALPSSDVRVHRGACFGDIDNDGRIDILVSAQNQRPTLLINKSDAGNWLLLRLKDRHGCCTPVGARCTATISGKRKLRVVLGGGSYGGESDHRVHFGLGASRQIEHLEIRWLSGTVQALHNVAANQILEVVERA